MERLGRYTLERKLSAGGMAEIHLAREAGQPRPVVVKRVAQSLAAAPSVVAMFFDEARVAAQLNHPGIAKVLDFGQDQGVLYLVMEWVDGENLRAITQACAAQGLQLGFAECAAIIAQVALALDAAWTAKGLDGTPLHVVHRDVSPHNVMLSRTGEVKLIDFGVAKASSARNLTGAGLIKGKFAYMSPEQLRGQPLDNRSDLFCLGLVLYELLTLGRAIPGQSDAEVVRNALAQKITPLDWARPDVPRALATVLDRLLEPDKERRPASGAEVSAELQRFIASAGVDVGAERLAALLPGPTPELGLAPRRRDEPVGPMRVEPTGPMRTMPEADPEPLLTERALPKVDREKTVSLRALQRPIPNSRAEEDGAPIDDDDGDGMTLLEPRHTPQPPISLEDPETLPPGNELALEEPSAVTDPGRPSEPSVPVVRVGPPVWVVAFGAAGGLLLLAAAVLAFR